MRAAERGGGGHLDEGAHAPIILATVSGEEGVGVALPAMEDLERSWKSACCGGIRSMCSVRHTGGAGIAQPDTQPWPRCCESTIDCDRRSGRQAGACWEGSCDGDRRGQDRQGRKAGEKRDIG